jgi:hypothetical protein
MTATTLSRAAQVAAVHLRPINESRRRAGLAALSADEVAREFAAVDRAQVRTKAVAPRTTSSTVAADSMWGGIVGKLNSAALAIRTPIGARRASPAPSSTQPNRAVDWSSIAADLNREAGLPARRAR